MSSSGKTKQFLDIPTLLIIGLMIFGTAGVVGLHHAERIPTALALLAGIFLMNLSFTAWHEPAHANFSTSRRMNSWFGWLSSFASVYPGYYARRREHLIHHRWQGDPASDPVYARIQTTFWGFPWTLLRLMIQRPKLDIPDSFVPFTTAQRMADWASHLSVLAVLLAGCYFGFWKSLMAAWIVPRLFVFWIHAYYVCFFAHSIPNGGFELFRVRRSSLLNWLTLGQSLHGVHHKWPSIPWHRYPRHVERLEEERNSSESSAKMRIDTAIRKVIN